MTKKSVTVSTTLPLHGESMRIALELQAVVNGAAAEQAAIQQEMQARADVIRKETAGRVKDLWYSLASRIGIADPDAALEANVWGIDTSYMEHGYVFLRRNSPDGDAPPGTLPVVEVAVH